MINKLSLLVSSMVILAAQSSIANADGLLDFNLCPYVGIDMAWRHQGFDNAFGGNVVRKTFPQGDVYLGVKFNEFVGIQVGYEGTTKRTKLTTFTGPYIHLGVAQSAAVGTYDQFITSTRLKGGHIDIVGFYPFCLCDEKFNLIGSIGVARVRFKTKISLLVDDGAVLTSPDFEDSILTFVARKYVARLALGIQYMLTDCVGLRFIGGWENTSRFNLIPTDKTLRRHVSLRNATTLGLGVFYNF